MQFFSHRYSLIKNIPLLLLILSIITVNTGCSESSSLDNAGSGTTPGSSPLNLPVSINLRQKEPDVVAMGDSDFVASCIVYSSDTNVVDIGDNTPADRFFKVIGLLSGTATITANCEYIDGSTDTDTMTVNVSTESLSELLITPSAPSVPMNISQQLNAIGIFSDGTSRILTNFVTWSSTKVESINTTVGLVISDKGLAQTSPRYGGKGIAEITAETFANNSTINVSGSINMVVGDPVDSNLRGQWLFVDSAEKVWIGSYYHLPLTQIEANLLSFVGTDFETYYLVRAGIDNVAVTGAVGDITATPKSITATKAAGGKNTRAFSGVGGIDVILTNIYDSDETQTVTTDIDGSFNTSIKSGTYQLLATDASGNRVRSEVIIDGEVKNIGAFTLADRSSYNFKAELYENFGSLAEAEPSNEFVYFGTKTYQPEITYSKNIRISNIGTQDVSGLSISILPDTPAAYYSFSAPSASQGIAAGSYTDVPITFSLKRPLTATNTTISVILTDIAGQTWNDKVVIPVSDQIPIKVTIQNPSLITSNSEGIDGYILSPGLKPIRITEYSPRYIPYTPTTNYKMAVSASSISNETSYAIGFGREVSAKFVDQFADTGINEPTNNVISTATNMTLYTKQLGYIHAGDIDFFTLDFISSTTPYDITATTVYDLSDVGHKIKFSNTHAFVSSFNRINPSSSGPSYIFDISTPATPVSLTDPVINIPSGVDIAAREDVTNTDYTLYITDETLLSIYGFTETQLDADTIDTFATYPYSLEYTNISGNLLYTIEPNGNVNAIDVTPATPSITRNTTVATTGITSGDVTISGNYLYVTTTGPTNNHKSLSFIDITAPATALPIASTIYFTDNGGYDIGNVVVNGTTAYVASTSALYSLDVTDLTAPSIVQHVTDNIACERVSLVDSTHVLCTQAMPGSLELWDVSDPADMFKIMSFNKSYTDTRTSPAGDTFGVGPDMDLLQLK